MRSGADLNGDSLRISRAYLRSGGLVINVGLRVRVWVRVRVRLQIVVYKLQEKAIKCGLKLTNKLTIRPAPHFVVSQRFRVDKQGPFV